ncbi:MAG TPA: glycoside hydrolase family 48 protein, partial [Kofleriaceae bacterium]|nr:glycoside hydrolase family 48 protein [Kofleriaceae bacterium]
VLALTGVTATAQTQPALRARYMIPFAAPADTWRYTNAPDADARLSTPNLRPRSPNAVRDWTTNLGRQLEGSNPWFAFQVWSMGRVAEYYYTTNNAQAELLLDTN